MTYRSRLALVLILCLAGCGRNGDNPRALIEQAGRIASTNIIVDTHIDLPYRLTDDPVDVSVAVDSGDFDYPRAVAGGLDAPFMSIYTEAELEAEGHSRAVADDLIDLVQALAEHSPEQFALARSPAEVRENFASGVISLPLGMENGSPIEGDLANLRYFFDRGIRYITLTHSLSNHIADSSFDENRPWQGLSDFGKALVREMNRLGIMVDVSHSSDDAFWQIIDISAVPVIASHSSARHFTPDWERNMSDDMIEALAAKGGVIMINFGSAFVTREAMDYSMARWAASDAYKLEHDELPEDEAEEQFIASWEAEHGPMPFASLDDVLDHYDHVVALVGVDHVGIGSDYDGVGDSLPTGLKDVSSYPNLVAGLLRRGYSEADIRKILGENLLRVWSAVENYAATTSTST